MFQFLAFVVLGVLYTVPPEYLNQVLIHETWSGYRTTILVNAVLLVFMFFLWRWLSRTSSDGRSRKGPIAYFFIAGILGLFVEWFLIGNHPLSDSLQLGMFAYWSGFLLLPAVILASDRQKWSAAIALAALFVVQFAAYLLLAASASRDAVIVGGVLIMTASAFVLWWWVLGYAFGWPARLKVWSYALFCIIEVALELALPTPIGAVIGFVGFLIYGWWLLRR
jgi:hypothetical protein